MNLQARARNIKLLAMDVDGVLTAGEIILLDSGEELKIWNVKDRMGFALLKKLWVTDKTGLDHREKIPASGNQRKGDRYSLHRAKMHG